MRLPLAGSRSVQDTVYTLSPFRDPWVTFCQDVFERIKDYILSHPDVKNNQSWWIEGMGWDQTKWPEVKFRLR